MLCSFVFFALPMEGSAQQKTKVTVELKVKEKCKRCRERQASDGTLE